MFTAIINKIKSAKAVYEYEKVAAKVAALLADQKNVVEYIDSEPQDLIDLLNEANEIAEEIKDLDPVKYAEIKNNPYLA